MLYYKSQNECNKHRSDMTLKHLQTKGWNGRGISACTYSLIWVHMAVSKSKCHFIAYLEMSFWNIVRCTYVLLVYTPICRPCLEIHIIVNILKERRFVFFTKYLPEKEFYAFVLTRKRMNSSLSCWFADIYVL